MVGGIRDLVLFRETKLILGFVAILVSALACNLILNAATPDTYFHLSLAGQPVAHTDGLWNFLGMLLAGFGCVLLGGCPLRQLVLSGEGNTDSAMTVIGSWPERPLPITSAWLPAAKAPPPTARSR